LEQTSLRRKGVHTAIIFTPKIQNQQKILRHKHAVVGKAMNAAAPTAVAEAKKINSPLACLTWSRTLLQCGGFSTLLQSSVF